MAKCNICRSLNTFVRPCSCFSVLNCAILSVYICALQVCCSVSKSRQRFLQSGTTGGASLLPPSVLSYSDCWLSRTRRKVQETKHYFVYKYLNICMTSPVPSSRSVETMVLYAFCHSVILIQKSSWQIVIEGCMLSAVEWEQSYFPQRPSLLSLRHASVWISLSTFRSCRRSPSSGGCVSQEWLCIKQYSVSEDIWILASFLLLRPFCCSEFEGWFLFKECGIKETLRIMDLDQPVPH